MVVGDLADRIGMVAQNAVLLLNLPLDSEMLWECETRVNL
jgi:hypothetical protein